MPGPEPDPGTPDGLAVSSANSAASSENRRLRGLLSVVWSQEVPMIAKSILIAALLAAGLSAQNPPQLPFPDLVGPLKATPGCLGVETSRTASGKLVIFAWFEDKKAVMRWYNSELHQQLVKMGGPPDPSHVPLAG